MNRFQLHSLVRRSTLLVLTILGLAGIGSVHAQTIAYEDPANQGGQAWGGNLGLLFHVNSPIVVTALGVFNASGSGTITGTIQVAIYDTTTNRAVTPVVTFHGHYTPAGFGFDVFQPITPVLLGIGSYEVDAVGFSSTDLNGNRSSCSIGAGCPSLGSSTGPVLNNGGGQLTFTGASFDASTVLDDPLTCTTYPCLPPPAGLSQFDAGTFEFGSAAQNSSQILPQLAFGGGWYTALYFTNTNTAPVSFTVSFTGNDGNPLTIPALVGSSITVNLASRGTALIEAPNVGPLVQGYVTTGLPTGVTGYGVFRQSVPGVPDQEAVVPLSGSTATASTLLFDDTKYVTGVAVANLVPVSNTITATARDNNGNTLGIGTIVLAAHAKTALVLRNIPGLANVAGAIGSVDFTASIGNIAALGLRFNGAAFTSIPTSDR